MGEEIINFDLLKDLFGNDKEAYTSFFDLFKEQTKIEIAALEKSIKENNRTEIARIAHKIKSSYGSIGSTSAYDILTEIERISKEEPDYGKIYELFEQFLVIHHNILGKIDKSPTV
jgi:HPt (histidine-containing phosphotransfer) domain-containing protein